LAAGDVYRSGNDVRTSGDQFEGIPQDTGVYYLVNEDIRWNLNRCEVVVGSARLPTRVNWYAALAFARYYGYDLPTDAEWEKAARGPDHDDLGEHWLYPWGNTISAANANLTGTRTDVGTYNGGQTPPGPDMVNAYGLYDVIGNAAEWTRSRGVSLDEYPQVESLASSIHGISDGNAGAVYRGLGKTYERNEYNKNNQLGFRVIRRAQ